MLHLQPKLHLHLEIPWNILIQPCLGSSHHGRKNRINAWERWCIQCLCKDCDLPVLFVTMQVIITLVSSLPCGHLFWEKPIKGTSQNFVYFPPRNGVPVEIVLVLNRGKDALFLKMSTLLRLQECFADVYIDRYVWSCIFLEVDLLLQDQC